MAPLVGDEVVHDLPNLGLFDPRPDGLEAGDHPFVDLDLLEDVLMKPHGGTHIHVRGDGSGPRFDVNEGLAEGCVLPAVVEDGP